MKHFTWRDFGWKTGMLGLSAIVYLATLFAIPGLAEAEESSESAGSQTTDPQLSQSEESMVSEPPESAVSLPEEQLVSIPEEPPTPTPPKPVVVDVEDNEVYLFTPEALVTMKRMSHGEIFDMDADLESQIALRPHVFSLYYFAGLVKVRRLLLSPDYKADDEKIVKYFTVCIDKAKKAEKVAKFRLAGMFYQALCGSGLGLFHGIRGNYLSAYRTGKDGMRALERTVNARDDLEAALLLQGIYNYFTGRFGTFTKFLLSLVGMPAGDYKLGIKQISRASEMNGPLNYFTSIFAVYVFAPSASMRKEALRIANKVIRSYPNNYYGYLLRGYVYLKMRKYKHALADNQRSRSMLNKDPKSYGDVILEADVFLLDSRIAFTNCLVYNKNEALAYLLKRSKDRKPSYADAPLIACMYLGHIYSLAGLDDKALGFYKKMQSFDNAEWMKDLGKRYEKMPMAKRTRLPKKKAQKLQTWLKSHPEAKP